MTINAVVFDAFGTIARIKGSRTRPFSKLIELLKDHGRDPLPTDSRYLMTNKLGIVGAAQGLDAMKYVTDFPTWNNQLATLENMLYDELSSIKLYPEVPEVMWTLHQMELKIGICSNLAAPYAIPILGQLPMKLDSYSWSFEVGHIKPDYEMYQHVCDRLQLPPEQILFVGDTTDADVTGPMKFGMKSMQVDRIHDDHQSDLMGIVNLINDHNYDIHRRNRITRHPN